MSCYTKENGTVIDVTGQAHACGSSTSGITTCCFNGDTCMSDGFCQYVHLGSPGGSGFYVASCTDPEFKNPNCPAQCGDEAFPDAVFDFGAGNWQCCGGTPSTGIQCNSPQGPTFSGPAPGYLTKQNANAQAIASTAMPSTTPRFNPHSINENHHHGLSQAAVIGISVGASVIVLLIIATVVLCIFQSYRRRKARPFKLGDEPALLPASIRNSEPSIPSVSQRNSMRSNSLRTLSTYVSDNGGEPWPLALPIGRRESRMSDLSAALGRGSFAESISTWSSFSGGGARESHLEITIPEPAVCEMGERTPQELSGLDPAVVHELQDGSLLSQSRRWSTMQRPAKALALAEL